MSFKKDALPVLLAIFLGFAFGQIIQTGNVLFDSVAVVIFSLAVFTIASLLTEKYVKKDITEKGNE